MPYRRRHNFKVVMASFSASFCGWAFRLNSRRDISPPSLSQTFAVDSALQHTSNSLYTGTVFVVLVVQSIIVTPSTSHCTIINATASSSSCKHANCTHVKRVFQQQRDLAAVAIAAQFGSAAHAVRTRTQNYPGWLVLMASRHTHSTHTHKVPTRAAGTPSRVFRSTGLASQHCAVCAVCISGVFV